MRNKASTVLAFEFRKVAASKTFWIATLVGTLAMAALIAIPAAMAAKAESQPPRNLAVGIFAPDENTRERAERFLVPALAKKLWTPAIISSEAECRAKVLDGSLDGYLEIPHAFPYSTGAAGFGWHAKNAGDFAAAGLVAKAVSDTVISARIERAGADEAEIRAIMEPTAISAYKVSRSPNDDGKPASESDFLTTFLTALAFAMSISMTVLLYGQQIGRSIVTDKSTRIVDVLLSSVTSEQLLFGKIAGIGLAGLLQYSVWLGGAAIAATAMGGMGALPAANVGMDKIAVQTAFFVGEYLLYSAAYAACGATADDDHHMAQLALPIVITLTFPIVIMQGIVQTPDSPMAIALSYIPLTSPSIMPIRCIAGSISWWEPALSLAILTATIVAAIQAAAKIFRVGIRMSGKNFSVRDIAKWLTA